MFPVPLRGVYAFVLGTTPDFDFLPPGRSFLFGSVPFFFFLIYFVSIRPVSALSSTWDFLNLTPHTSCAGLYHLKLGVRLRHLAKRSTIRFKNALLFGNLLWWLQWAAVFFNRWSFLKSFFFLWKQFTFLIQRFFGSYPRGQSLPADSLLSPLIAFPNTDSRLEGHEQSPTFPNNQDLPFQFNCPSPHLRPAFTRLTKNMTILSADSRWNQSLVLSINFTRSLPP